MCAAGQMCTAGSCVSGPPDPPTATCSGTRGRDVGTTVPSATFTDCDGNEVSLDYLCGYDAAWVYSFATWCGICRSEMRTINDWVATQPADRFEMLIVVTSTTEHGTPNAAYCDSIRDEFGLTNATVLFDDGNRFLNTFYYGGAGAEMAYENGVMVQKGGVTRGLIESLL
jgi:thiol-disulfide isomerase/thioredoxin